MPRSDVKTKQHHTNPISLAVVAVVILLIWQSSTLFLPINGPFDIIFSWVAVAGAYLSQSLMSVSIPIITISIISSIGIYIAFRFLTLIKWKRLLRTLQGYLNMSSQELQNKFPIRGIEVTSLPFLQPVFDSDRIGDHFFASNSDNPYQFSHWVALNNKLKEVAFDVNIDSEVKIRFWVPKNVGTDDLDLLYSSLKTNCIDFEFQQAPHTAVTDIFGSNPYHSSVQGDYIKFGDECVSVVLVEGFPHSSFEGHQIDRLIHAILDRDIRASFIVNFAPAKNPTKSEQENSVESDPRNTDWGSITLKRWNQTAQEELSFGFWKVSAYLVVRSNDDSTHLSKVKSAKIILETIFLNPFNPIQTRILKGHKLQRALTKIIHRKRIGKTGLLSSRQLSYFVHFPKEAQPGYTRKHSPIFELPPQKQTQIQLFQVMKGNRELYPAGIDLTHLTTHMVVAGQTGRGKTRFVGNLVKQIQRTRNVGITIFDWKGEYQSLMRTTYKIGLDNCPLKINLFETHGFDDIEQYVQNLVALFREMLKSDLENGLSSQMERILRESLIEYLSRGVGNYEEFETFLSSWISQNKKRFSNPESSTAGLINRFGILFRGRLGYVFNTSVTTVDFETFLADQVCLDLSNLAAYNKEDARLFLNALLLVIRTYLFRSFSSQLRYLVIAEEAQYIVPEVFTKRSSADASPVEDITLFQRAYGAGLIAVTTRPSLISRNILANSSSKIFFQCPLDSNLVGETINLTNEQRQFISLMPERIVIAHLPWFEHPFKAKVSSFTFPEPIIIRQKEDTSNPPSSKLINPDTEKLTKSEITNLSPLERHFLDLVCTTLHEHRILHRICNVNEQIVIDLTRQQILIMFFETEEQLSQANLTEFSQREAAILILCPPRIKSRFQKYLILKTTNYGQHQKIISKTYLASLTRQEIQKVCRYLVTGQLQKFSIDNQTKTQNQLLLSDIVSN